MFAHVLKIIEEQVVDELRKLEGLEEALESLKEEKLAEQLTEELEEWLGSLKEEELEKKSKEEFDSLKEELEFDLV